MQRIPGAPLIATVTTADPLHITTAHGQTHPAHTLNHHTPHTGETVAAIYSHHHRTWIVLGTLTDHSRPEVHA